MPRSTAKIICALTIGVVATQVHAQDDALKLLPNDVATKAAAIDQRGDDAPADVLSPEEWRRVDEAVARALAWLMTQQQPDGSFPTLDGGQPGVTSLCVLAFMAHGHNPGDGQYGQRLQRATDFILESQKQNGLVTRYGPEGLRISRDIEETTGVTAAYNHAISSLTLAEMYGMSESVRTAPIQLAITRALAASLEMQRWPSVGPRNLEGGAMSLGKRRRNLICP